MVIRELERFSRERCCWLATVRPDGRPHLVPVWFVCKDGLVYILSQSSSVKVRNLLRESRVTLCLPDPMEVFILEGTARLAPEARAGIRSAFLDKYEWDIATDPDYDAVIEIRPWKVFGWGETGDKFRWYPPRS